MPPNMNELILPCKSYVKRYLINNYGNPVDFRKNRYFGNYFKMLLERKICQHNKRIHLKQYGKQIYKSEVIVFIDDDTFNRFGFDLTAQSVVDFNMFIEDYIKSQSRAIIFTANSFGQAWVDAIRNFQNAFGFSEDDFSTEAIRKDLQRNKEILEILEKSFGTNVPDFGTNVSNTV